MDSREYFQSASAAQRLIDAKLAAIESMRAREGVRAQRYDRIGGSGKGGVSDPMRATTLRIDAEERAKAELKQYQAEVESARAVCSGFSKLNPHSIGGGCLELHYIELLTWRDTAAYMGVSETTARRAASAALDWLDAYGVAYARDYAKEEQT